MRHSHRIAMMLSAGVAAGLVAVVLPTVTRPGAPASATPVATMEAARRDPAARADVASSLGTSVSPWPPRHRAAADAAVLAALQARRAHSSLRGSEPDGDITFDAAGRLRHGPGLRRRFEHYLALLGEFEVDEIARLLHADTAAAHGVDAADQVDAAFARYLGLRRAIAETELATDLRTRHAQIEALRRQWFGSDADALFGDVADYDAYTLARLALREATATGSSQREQALQQLRDARPAHERGARDLSESAQLAQQQSQQFDARSLDAEARYEERSATWGTAAAERLAALDREQERWEQRLQRYARERRRVLTDPQRDPAARQRALSEWRRQHFTPAERIRIEALDAIGAIPTNG